MIWRKSSRCDTGTCVEVAWQKSSRCESGNCVEVARDADVYVRDSKDPTGPILRFDRQAWADFLHGVTQGEFRAPT